MKLACMLAGLRATSTRHDIVSGTLLMLATVVSAGTQIAIVPGDIRLSGPKARQRLLAEEMRAGHAVGEITDKVKFTSRDPKIVMVRDGLAIPIANGKATIVVQLGNQTAEAEATVVGLDKPFSWSFRNDV